MRDRDIARRFIKDSNFFQTGDFCPKNLQTANISLIDSGYETLVEQLGSLTKWTGV